MMARLVKSVLAEVKGLPGSIRDTLAILVRSVFGKHGPDPEILNLKDHASRAPANQPIMHRRAYELVAEGLKSEQGAPRSVSQPTGKHPKGPGTRRAMPLKRARINRVLQPRKINPVLKILCRIVLRNNVQVL
jgi:hypothetical protein